MATPSYLVVEVEQHNQAAVHLHIPTFLEEELPFQAVEVQEVETLPLRCYYQSTAVAAAVKMKQDDKPYLEVVEEAGTFQVVAAEGSFPVVEEVVAKTWHPLFLRSFVMSYTFTSIYSSCGKRGRLYSVTSSFLFPLAYFSGAGNEFLPRARNVLGIRK
jgi:hypothetical protein